MLTNLLLNQATADEKLYVEDVFSTYLYTGTGSSTQAIANGIDLTANTGLVWIKSRNNASANNALYDTVRGIKRELRSNAISAETVITGTNGLITFNNNGFSVSRSGTGGDSVNLTGDIYVSWTFRKAAKFFDCVTWTGNGSDRTISHSLGSAPGMIIVKRTDTTADWQVYHRSLANTEYVVLNTTAAKATGATRWNSTTATDTVFSLGTDSTVNASGGSYVAYLFAHDTSADGIIQCGSYTGATGQTIELGWEPQFVLIKRAGGTSDWAVIDIMRNASFNSDSSILFPNLSGAENVASGGIEPQPTGFSFKDTGATTNLVPSQYVYMAVRRGPMRVPTDATKVFQPVVYTGTNVDNRLVDTTIAPDMVMVRQRNDAIIGGMVCADRLRGQPYCLTGTTAAELADGDSFDAQLVGVEYGTAFSAMNGFYCGNDATAKLNQSVVSNNHIALAFKRAPGFFDVTCYSGTGSARTVSHNLGVAPELMIVKCRNTAELWAVYHSSLGATKHIQLNATGLPVTTNRSWNDTAPTSTVFSVRDLGAVNANGQTYVAYLFASCPGVSKVFSFTGNGSSQNIDCGFTNGARFVLIKRTDSTGNWLVADTARGLVSGNDPSLALNSTAAEVTSLDWLDPLSTGFTVNQESTNNANVNGATYIGIAIA